MSRMAIPMRARFLAVLMVVAACSAPPPPLSDHGSGALTQPISTMNDLVDWMRQQTDACDDLSPASRDEFARFVGPQLAELYEPFVAEWATCSVPPFPKVGLVLFQNDQFKAFQTSWRDAMAAGRVSDGPPFGFGNGFAVTQGFLGTSRLGLYYLRCYYDDPRVHQVQADVEHCVFANPEHTH
jgi:hypothetical protein